MKSQKSEVYYFACCVFLIAIAMGVRIYRITGESVWWDEYTSLMHLSANSLKEFLFLNPLFDPATLPGYYILEYLFWHYISPSVLGLRIFSILLSVSTIPVLYLIGKQLGSQTIGIIAGLFFAISPIHRFHGQGIRMYVLLTLLAALSIYYLLLWTKNLSKQNLILLSFVNLFLIWTHPFAFLIIGIEILWVIFFLNINRLKKGVFFLLQLLIVLSLVVYLLKIEYFAPEHSSWFTIPSLYELLGDVFADDAVGMTYQLRIIPSLPQFITSIHPVMDGLLVLFTIMGFIIVIRDKYRKGNSDVEKKTREIEEIIFLFALVIVPPLVLYFLSLFWRPCIFPRYTVYSSLAIYLIYGCIAESYVSRYLKHILLLSLLVIFSYQLLLTCTGPQRTNWQGCAHFIEEQQVLKSKNVPVFVFQAINKDVFSFNFHNKNIPVAYVEDMDSLITIVQEFFRKTSACFYDEVWFVYVSFYFGEAGSKEFEQLANESHLIYEYKDFEGIEPIRVYKIMPQEEVEYPGIKDNKLDNDLLKTALFDPVLTFVETNHKDCASFLISKLISKDPLQKLQYQNLYNSLNNNSKEVQRFTMALRYYQMSQRSITPKYKDYFLKKAIELDKDLNASYLCLDAIMTSIHGDAETTLQKIEDIIALYPDLALPRIGLGIIALADNQEEEAKKWLYSVLNCEGGIYQTWKPLLDLIFIEKDYKKALEEYYRLRAEDIFVDPFFEEYLTVKIKRD